MKKIISICLLLFIALCTINVKADSYSYQLELEDDNWEYLNMIRQVKSGDVVTVNAVINPAVNYNKWIMLKEGKITLEWDENVFELVRYDDETIFSEPALYSIKNSDLETIDIRSQSGTGEGYISIDFTTDYDYLKYGKNKIIEFKFKVRDNVKDGRYTIKQTGDYFKMIWDDYCDDCESIDSYLNSSLSFQVGDLPVSSSYSKNMIPNSTYVIGDHLFTRDGSDEYNGVLTTEYIMLASKTIDSNKKEDMIIYAKNARGKWVNAITNESINVPDYFDISHIDMKNIYKNSGVYVKDDIAVGFVEIDDDNAYLMIESDKLLVEGIASIRDTVASLTVDGKTYNITIGKDKISLRSNDQYLSNCELNKKYLYTLTDVYESVLYQGEKQYFSSRYNGKYVLGNKEIYTYQTGEGSIRVIIIDNDQEENKTIFDWYMYMNDSDNEIVYGNYKIVFEDNKIKLTDTSANSTETYTKEKRITIEEAIKLIVQNQRLYAVHYITDIDNGYDRKDFYHENSVIYNPASDLPTVPGHEFVGWYLGDTKFNFDNRITAPITLVAKWEMNIPTPVLNISETNDYNSRIMQIENVEDYCVSDVCNGNYNDEYNIDGYEIYEVDGNDYNLVEYGYFLEGREVDFTPNTNKEYVARVYVKDANDRVYSNYSNKVAVDTTFPVPTIAFASESMASSETFDVIANIEISNIDSYGYVSAGENTWESYKVDGFALYEKIGDDYMLVKTIEPGSSFEAGANYGDIKHYYVRTFAYNGYNDPVYSEYSNELVLSAPIPVPQVSFDSGTTHFAQGLSIDNTQDYCIGTCDGNNDEYMVDGYVVYEKQGSNYVEITTVNGINESANFVANVDNASANKVYVVRTFIDNAGEKTYSEYSNELVLEYILAPVIQASTAGESDRQYLLSYDGGHDERTFRLNIYGNYSIHRTCNPNDANDCVNSVEGYELFEKNGDVLTSIEENIFGGEATVYVQEGSAKTYVAKAYILDNSNHRIYSSISNEITIDLTNPTYTFETVESINDSNKVNVRGYINNYEVALHGIKINDITYHSENADEYEFVTVEKSVIENVNSVILGIDSVNQLNPDDFTVEVEATRSN